MYTIQAILEVSQTVLAAAACIYFLGALLKQVKTRKRNPAPFIWLLLIILLISVTELAVMIVRADGLPNIQPMTASILYILGLLLQIDYLWKPTNNEENLAWHAVLGSWIAMAVFDILSIVEFVAVAHYVAADLVCAAVATGLRFCLVIVLFVAFTWPNREGYIRLTDNDLENGTAGGSNLSSGRDKQLRLYSESVLSQIRAAGGTWLWVKKFQIFLPWIWPRERPWMIICVVLAQLLQQFEIALQIYTPYANGAFAESVVQAYRDRNLSPIWAPFFVLLSFRLAILFVGFIKRLLMLSYRQFRTMHVEKSIHAHLMDHDAAFHDEINSEEIFDASQGGPQICEALDFLGLETIPQTNRFVGGFITLFSLYGSHVALTMFATISIYTIFNLRWTRILMPLYDERNMARKKTKHRREGAIRGHRAVVLNGQIDREIKAHDSSLRAYMDVDWKLEIRRIAGELLLPMIPLLGEYGTVIAVILLGIQDGGSVGHVIAFRGYWSLLQSPLDFFMNLPETLMRRLYSTDQLRRVMEVKPSMKYGPEDLKTPRSCIELKNVTFGYTSSNSPILKDFNLVIEPKKTTAIVGPSGIGKTTLLDLIARLYDPVEGSIEFDGQDMKTLRKGILPRHIAYMTQSQHLFNDTVGNNIKYGYADATVAEMHEAAQRAGIHSTIVKLDDGYDTMVGKAGRNFSGGEKQRITLARTLLSPGSVMLLDEATSSLDIDLELHIKNTLKATDKTLVIIAHRLPSVKDADNIVVLGKKEDGCIEISEQGTHDELLKRNGIYMRLCRKYYGEAQTEEKAREITVEELFEM